MTNAEVSGLNSIYQSIITNVSQLFGIQVNIIRTVLCPENGILAGTI